MSDTRSTLSVGGSRTTGQSVRTQNGERLNAFTAYCESSNLFILSMHGGGSCHLVEACFSSSVVVSIYEARMLLLGLLLLNWFSVI